MTIRKSYRIILLFCVLFLSLGIQASAMQITPEVKQKLIDDGQLHDYISLLLDARSRGVDAPNIINHNRSLASSVGEIDTLNVLLLLVDFTDNRYTSGSVAATPADFDSILFSTDYHNPTGSMTEFYMENSYGTFLIRGQVHGWYLMPETYAYYVNDSSGIGSFPHNSQGLAIDAIETADNAGLDFSQFDTYSAEGASGGDGEIDGLIIVHSGPGYQQTGNSNDMMAHKWSLGGDGFSVDGVLINAYTIQSEELYNPMGSEIQPIGVFCHEFGHVLGLPDLYDVDYSPTTSVGVGDWSVMGTGVYNGDSRKPAHFDAWCKAFIGFVIPVDVTSNITAAEIPQVESEPVVYKLTREGLPSSQYFLVENRRRVGFDAALPGEGLLIYHVDDAYTFNNISVEHYHVAVEQADGLFQLEYAAGNEGDPGDPWPGSSNKRSFDDLSTPASRFYNGISTEVSVWDISDPDSLMTANLDVFWSRPHFDLNLYTFQDYQNGVIEAGETIEFYFDMLNTWLTATNVTVTLSSNDPGILFTQSTATFASMPGDSGYTGNLSNPIVFTVADTITPTYDSFFVTIESDNHYSDTTFAIEKQVGNPQVLVVDDDRGGSYEEMYLADFYKKRIPTDYWNKQSMGAPSAMIMNKYNIVVWFTGDTSSNLLQSTDITAMEQFLGNGGSLFLTGQGIAGELHTEDSAFLYDYLHTLYDTLNFAPIQNGENGSPIGQGLIIKYFSGCNQDYLTAEQIIPVNGAIPAFSYSFYGGYTSLSYTGAYKLVFFDWGYEAIENSLATYGSRDTVLYRVLEFFSNLTTEVADENSRQILPGVFELEQNYPNPFNPTTTIRYALGREDNGIRSNTTLKIYNTLGQEVKTLVNEAQYPGSYTVEWNGTNNEGRRVASGVYFYALQRGENRLSKKMIFLK
jgi:immune inhibitor A